MNKDKKLLLEIMPAQLYGEAYIYKKKYTIYESNVSWNKPYVLANLKSVTTMEMGYINIADLKIPPQLLYTVPTISSLEKYTHRNFDFNFNNE